MTAIKNISIPQACHEPWQQMENSNNGRYCMQCSKTVIDFSTMNNDEIIGYLSTVHNNVCGRFGSDQLNIFNQNLNKEDIITLPAWRKWLVAAGLFIATMFIKANAQTGALLPTKVEQTDAIISHCNDVMGKLVYNSPFKKKVITGRVLDETDAPVPGATVKQGKVFTTTDMAGNFSIRVPESASKLLVSYIGYNDGEIALYSNPNFQVKLKLVPMMMGEVMVVRQSFLKRNYNRFIRRPIYRLFK